MAVRGFSFEVFGKVQGVWFRKHTKRTADSLGLVGYVMNTTSGTVKGECQAAAAEADALVSFKSWLRTTGSPKSRIDKAVFNDHPETDEFSYEDFSIYRPE